MRDFMRAFSSPAPGSQPVLSRFEDCTVTSVSPLRIRFDGSVDDLPFEPDTMVPVAALAVNDRVRVEVKGGRVVIVGRAGGVTRAATPVSADDIATKGFVEAGLRLITIVYFTTSGTFTKASYPGARAIRVKVQGGGGAGGGAAATTPTNYSAGCGGGGGGYCEKLFTDLSVIPSSVAVTVGAGGTGVSGTTGGTGGASSFGTLMTANGGVGGWTKPNDPYAPYVWVGEGGSATGGDLNIGGGSGSPATGYSTLGMGGTGGSSHLGGGGIGRAHGSGNTSAMGGAGKAYGGGGGGSLGTATSAAVAGGSGAAGIVIVEVYA